MNRQIIRVVGAAIIDSPAGEETVSCEVSRRRCLVAQRSATMSNPLQWEFPGGKVEVDEDPKQALVREIGEELSIEIEVGKSLGSTEVTIGHGEQRRRIALQVFVCRWLRGEVQLAEHHRWRWIEAREVAALTWSEADRPLLDHLVRYLNTGRMGDGEMGMEKSTLTSNG